MHSLASAKVTHTIDKGKALLISNSKHNNIFEFSNLNSLGEKLLAGFNLSIFNWRVSSAITFKKREIQIKKKEYLFLNFALEWIQKSTKRN